MKKLMLTSLMAVFAMSAANAANYFVGGSASFEGAKGEHNTSWSVAPEFGWHLNDKWDAGITAGFEYRNSFMDEETNAKVDMDLYTYGVEGFARYNVAQFGAFNVLLDGRVGAYALTFDMDSGTETAWGIGAEVSPMVTYNLSDSFTLYAKLNFLGVNAEYVFKNKDLGMDKDAWEFSAGVDSSNLMNTKDFQIGFYYNF